MEVNKLKSHHGDTLEGNKSEFLRSVQAWKPGFSFAGTVLEKVLNCESGKHHLFLKEACEEQLQLGGSSYRQL